ncbi:MAG: serine peptidase, partial [Notoacmeibacter sp.]
MLSTILNKQTALRTGVAALALIVGGAFLTPFQSPAFAEAVRVEGVQTVGFADVVEKVQPAVVSVRVKSKIDDVAFNNGSEGTNGRPDFDIPGFEDLPDDHPMRRFFKEFGERRGNENGSQNDGRRADGNNNPRRNRPGSQGSGFFISDDGYIVTNNHVIEGGATFTVVMNDGKEIDA